MTYRTILAPLCGSETDRSALAMAFSVAQTFSGHVDALFLRTDPSESILMLGDGFPASIIDALLRTTAAAIRVRATQARAAFDAAASSAHAVIVDSPTPPGRLTARWRERVGVPSETVIEEARVVDLLVFDRSIMTDDSLDHHIVEMALLYGTRPVLIAPGPLESAAGGRLGTHVAIAWNGRSESARAVAAAMPFLMKAQSVRVLTAETAKTRLTEAGRLVEYLAWCGVRAEAMVVGPDDEGVGAALAHHAEISGGDLLVMGGYGSNRMREMFLGSVTRQVIERARLPVLIAH
ncbi:Universal stress protein UspA [Azospirillaceae bacterium]